MTDAEKQALAGAVREDDQRMVADILRSAPTLTREKLRRMLDAFGGPGDCVDAVSECRVAANLRRGAGPEARAMTKARKEGKRKAPGRSKRSARLPEPRMIDLTAQSIRRGETFGIVGATAQSAVRERYLDRLIDRAVANHPGLTREEAREFIEAMGG